ncbi:hypothetical protein ACFQ1S_08770 [Kibdelosporangium lantanae]|uniref:Head-tail adaptor protein n=1 Tax=Kibdelosporangium lantanae TaxID=1497396 RepID=A0ABW3M4P2_9PSEU
MQLSHRLVVVSPIEVTDEYDNPTASLEYGPSAPRREIWGQLQPAGSRDDPQPGRQPVISTWRLFTFSPIHARERIEWQGRALDVQGEPDAWAPRPGRTHYEAKLSTVEG